MSKHSTSALTMRDALYEAPGPKMRAKIRVGTAISLVAVAALIALVLQRFYVTSQLSVHYWYFFTHLTTWKFLLAGFEGTVKVALTAGAIALVLGLALMLGRTSDIKPLQLVCRVLTDFFRGVPSLLFIYFFFLVLPQYKISLPSFWMLTLPVALAVLVLQRFYVTGQLSVHYWYFFTHLTTWKFLLAGFEGTVKVALTAGAIALVLGLALMLGRTSDIKPLQLVCRVLTDFFRGVPSLLFIYFFFLVLPQYKIALPSFWMLTLPVALAAAGVLAEIFRAGVNAVPRGQVEAAQALGLSKAKITFKIVLPQAIRFIIPSLISQLVVVVKDTTVAYVVSYPDLMQNARVLITNYDALVSVYLVIAVIYILINVAINKAAVYVSHKTGATIIR